MGVILSLFSESLPPKSKFNVENIPDLTGKVIIVTGANTGEYLSRFLSVHLLIFLLQRRWKGNGQGSLGCHHHLLELI